MAQQSPPIGWEYLRPEPVEGPRQPALDKLSAHYGLRFEQAQLERRAASNGARSKTNRL